MASDNYVPMPQRKQYVGAATDRTVSQLLRGEINTPLKQLSPEQRLQYEKAKALEQKNKGVISQQEANQRINTAQRKWEIESQQRTIREGQKAARAGKSARTKQDESRALASRYGVAIGTINEGKGSVSNQSRIANNINVNNFRESQKQPKQNKSYEITLTEGKETPKEKVNYSYEVSLTENKKPNYLYEVTLTEGQKKQQIQQDNILAKYEKDNPLQNIGAGLYNSLRYYDAVKSKEVEEPKGIEWLNYYASKGLSPIFNIPLGLMGDKKLTPTLSETAFDTGFELVTKGKTKTHDPIGDYIRKDPLGTLAQVPAEGALWITGGKAVGVGTKAFKTFSPIQYEAKKILTSEGKTESIIKSITNQGKPIVSIQQGKITKGYDPSKLSYEKINVKTREGFEASVGSGIEKEIFYSEKALTSQVNRGLIPNIAKTRASAWVKAVEQAKGVTSKGGTLGKEPIEGLTQKQSDSIFKGVEKGQKAGEIDLIHGSTATKAGVPESIQKQAGSSLKLGDIDITPKGKDLKKTADKLIKSFARDLPLTPGQRLSIKGIGSGDNVNRSITISGGKFKEPTKILEVVLKSSDESKYGISQGNKILNQNIPFKKSMKVKDYPIKTHTADYQLLTNVKQALSFQKGKDTMFDIYTSSGRTKDIVRGYWNLKGKAVFKGGEKGKDLDKQAEYIRSLYPKLEFTDYTPEKVLLYSSRIESKTNSKGLSQLPLKMELPKGDSSFEKEVKSIRENPNISIKPSSSRLMTSRYQPKVITQSLESFSARQKNITNRVNSMTSRINSRKPISNIPLYRPISNRPVTQSRQEPPLSIKDKPSIFDKSIKDTLSSITKPPQSIKSPPPKTPFNKLLGRVPQSRGLENPYMDRLVKRPTAIIPIDIKNTTKKTKGSKGESHNFLAWTNVSSVLGVRTTKKDIDVGDKKTERLYRENILSHKRKYQKSDKKNSKSLLGNNKQSKTSFW